MEHALRKATYRAIIRILTLPPNHPLHEVVKTIKDNPPTRHASPIATLLRIYKLMNAKLETITPSNQLSWLTNKFTTKISNSREESITNEKEDKADFKVFSDGSGLDGGIGAAAIIYSKERNTPINHLKKYIGPKEKHNTYEAEIVGALLATWIIRCCPSTVAKTVSLYIDNQAVIQAIGNPKAKPGQHLLRQLNLLANSLACNLKIRWISSHSKVKGNEKVDKLAKEAALGKSSPRNKLPHQLRDPLPASASAAKQQFHEVLKEKWKEEWNNSDRGRKLAIIDEDFPFNAFRNRTNQLTRHQASLMIQIRCGHLPLNAYLARIGKTDTEYCQGCMENEGRLQCRETVKHYIFECTTYAQEREELIENLKLSYFNLRNIMADADRMRHLATYINKTGRLKQQRHQN